MASRNPSYITQNRLGIYIFQLKIPKHFRSNHPQLGILFRKSLRTRDKREAMRLAKRLSVLMDELAREYFENEAAYVKSIKVLQEYQDAESLYPKWEDLEENFLCNLDDHESVLLEKALKHQRAKKLDSPDSTAAINDGRRLKAIQELNSPILSESRNPFLDSVMNDFKQEKKTNLATIHFFIRYANHHNGSPIHVNEINDETVREFINFYKALPKGLQLAKLEINALKGIEGKPPSPKTLIDSFGCVKIFLKWLKARYPKAAIIKW